jgi:hypothetical protein
VYDAVLESGSQLFERRHLEIGPLNNIHSTQVIVSRSFFLNEEYQYSL